MILIVKCGTVVELLPFIYIFYKIPDNDSNPAGSRFPAASRGPIRVTRRELVAHAVLQVCCDCLYQGLELL